MMKGSFLSSMIGGGASSAVTAGLQGSMGIAKTPSSISLGQRRGSRMNNDLRDLASHPPELLIAEQVKKRANRGILA